MRRYAVVLKIIAIVLLSLLFAFLVERSLYFTAMLAGLFITLLGFSLYRDQQRTVRKMEQLIASIRYNDLKINFPSSKSGKSEKELIDSMNEALASFRSNLYNSVVTETETEAWQKLIRVLTHEIMNSIAPIISLSETVSERTAAEGMNEKNYQIMLQAIEAIHRRSTGLLDFVENYRQLTRIPTPVITPFTIQHLFKNLEGLFHPQQVRITYTIRPQDLRLHADRSLIEQVVINLIKNALEAVEDTPNPEIRVEAFRQEGNPAIRVSDNGAGIVPEALDKVFVPFYTTKTRGSGIGLSICRQIINRHGGKITVTSEPEKGTAFTLLFPHVRVSY